jgi:hypothetical protein
MRPLEGLLKNLNKSYPSASINDGIRKDKIARQGATLAASFPGIPQGRLEKELT